MGPSQIFAFLEIVALAATWIWVMRRKHSVHGRRRKASITGFILISLAVCLNAILALVMHVQSSDNLGSHIYFGLILLMSVMSLTSLTLGIFGKGGTRVPTIAWSCIILLTCAFTFVGAFKALRAAESSSLRPPAAQTLWVG